MRVSVSTPPETVGNEHAVEEQKGVWEGSAETLYLFGGRWGVGAGEGGPLVGACGG